MKIFNIKHCYPLKAEAAGSGSLFAHIFQTLTYPDYFIAVLVGDILSSFTLEVGLL